MLICPECKTEIELNWAKCIKWKNKHCCDSCGATIKLSHPKLLAWTIFLPLALIASISLLTDEYFPILLILLILYGLLIVPIYIRYGCVRRFDDKFNESLHACTGLVLAIIVVVLASYFDCLKKPIQDDIFLILAIFMSFAVVAVQTLLLTSTLYFMSSRSNGIRAMLRLFVTGIIVCIPILLCCFLTDKLCSALKIDADSEGINMLKVFFEEGWKLIGAIFVINRFKLKFNSWKEAVLIGFVVGSGLGLIEDSFRISYLHVLCSTSLMDLIYGRRFIMGLEHSLYSVLAVLSLFFYYRKPLLFTALFLLFAIALHYFHNLNILDNYNIPVSAFYSAMYLGIVVIFAYEKYKSSEDSANIKLAPQAATAVKTDEKTKAEPIEMIPVININAGNRRGWRYKEALISFAVLGIIAAVWATCLYYLDDTWEAGGLSIRLIIATDYAVKKKSGKEVLEKIKRTISKYDKNGNCFEENEYDAKNALISKIIIKKQKDVNGDTEYVRYNDPDGVLMTRDILKHDKNGKAIEELRYNSKGDMAHKTIFRYDFEGNNIAGEMYNTDGKLKGKYISKYDRRGNSTEREIFREDGTLCSKSVIKYNRKDKEIEKAEYDDKGVLVKIKISTYKYY